jgi:hypothetical protein
VLQASAMELNSINLGDFLMQQFLITYEAQIEFLASHQKKEDNSL